MLVDVSFEVAPGQTVALVGKTGAGKTTIAGLIPRFYDVTGGRVLLDGHDVRALTRKSVRKPDRDGAAGAVLVLRHARRQHRLRPAGRRHAPRSKRRRAPSTRTTSSRALPGGYETVIGEGGGTLSQGQRQLVAFARAVLADPRILILDEATANIDTRTEGIIQRALGTLLAGRTSVVIAHRLSTIRSADLILVVDAGRIVERGTHDALIAAGGVYADLYRRQFRAASRRRELTPPLTDAAASGRRR